MLRIFSFTALAAIALISPARGLAHAVQTDVSSLLPSGSINLRDIYANKVDLDRQKVHSKLAQDAMAFGTTPARKPI